MEKEEAGEEEEAAKKNVTLTPGKCKRQCENTPHVEMSAPHSECTVLKCAAFDVYKVKHANWSTAMVSNMKSHCIFWCLHRLGAQAPRVVCITQL